MFPVTAWLLSLQLQPNFHYHNLRLQVFLCNPQSPGGLWLSSCVTPENIVPKSWFRVCQHLEICQALNVRLVRLNLPEYFPPLLLLMKQRMSRTSSSSTTALTTPMNQPCVAKLGCTSVTPSEGIKSKKKKRLFGFCMRSRSRIIQKENKRLESRAKESVRYVFCQSDISLRIQRIQNNMPNTSKGSFHTVKPALC